MKKICLSFLCTIFCATVYTQSVERYVISSFGGSYYNGTNFEMDFSMGEVIVSSFSDGSHALTQGFEQPFTAIKVIPDYNDSISVFPNPFVDQFTIRIFGYGNTEFDFMIYDVLGQIVLERNIVTDSEGYTQVFVDLWKFAAGNYYLRIVKNGNLMKAPKYMTKNYNTV